jgi:hypothetical protein
MEAKDVIHVPEMKHRTRVQKILYTFAGALTLLVVVGGIMVTTFPNTLIHFIVEPKLKQLVTDRLGRRYALEMNSINLSSGKDSLVLVGVRIVDNGRTSDGSTDTSATDFGVATPLDRLTTDTVVIAGLDYWKLIFQQGLFADAISIRSPKIYLRPGTLPKFEENTDLLPSFLPAVSAKLIKITDAEVYLSENVLHTQFRSTGMNGLQNNSGGVLVKNANLEFRDFYLDEEVFEQGVSTFFCKSATFNAEDISHVDSLGVTDIYVEKVEGNLIDSSMNVHNVVGTKLIEEVRQTSITHIEFIGLDWYKALAGKGLHGRTVTITSPKIYLQDIADIRPHPTVHFASSDLIPLPSLLPNVVIDHIMIENAEVYALLPQSHNVSSLKRITMSLDKFALNDSTPFTNISSFFSESAGFGIQGGSTLSTALGTLYIGSVNGTEKSIAISNIRLNPSLKELDAVTVKKIEIGGVDIWKLLMREGFFCANVNVFQPAIYLDKDLMPAITSFDSLLQSDPLLLIRTFKEYPLPTILPIAGVGELKVSDASVHGIHLFDDPAHPSVAGDSLQNITLSLKNFKLDERSWTRKRGMLFSDAARFSAGAMKQYTPGATYRYSEGGIKGDLGKRTLTINEIAMQPTISQDSFGTAFKYRTERIDIFAPRIEISGVDYQKLLLGEGVFVDKIVADNWKIDVFGDRRQPEEPRTKKDKFPHELLQQIRMPFGINQLLIHGGDVTFSERWYDTASPATITLNDINLRVGSVSNRNITKSAPMSTSIAGDMKFLNTGLVSLTAEYQLMNPHLALDLQGKLGSMDASVLNDFLARSEPFTLTGKIQSADFNFHLSGPYMSGMITPQYDSLVVTFFRWDGFPPGFFSFFANTFFMRSHNTLPQDDPLHKAEISTTLDPDVNAFWALWHPIRSGIGDIVRIPEWVW